MRTQDIDLAPVGSRRHTSGRTCTPTVCRRTQARTGLRVAFVAVVAGNLAAYGEESYSYNFNYSTKNRRLKTAVTH